MTREDVLKMFPEATDDQITALLNKANGEVAKEKEKSEKLKTEIVQLKEENGRFEDLQAQIEEAENSKLTEIEKITKQLELSNQRVAELERLSAIRDQRISAAEKFKITAEQAGQIVKDDGSFDMDLLGQIISEKEAAAATAKEQEIANASTNPGGRIGGESGTENGIAEKLAVSSAKRASAANEDILKHYRR